jgi:hypothetical protein
MRYLLLLLGLALALAVGIAGARSEVQRPGSWQVCDNRANGQRVCKTCWFERREVKCDQPRVTNTERPR